MTKVVDKREKFQCEECKDIFDEEDIDPSEEKRVCQECENKQNWCDK